jgi:Putative Flp pilus-assembly TadE/G-like
MRNRPPARHAVVRARLVEERGQTLPLACIFFVVLLGLSGLVVDLGDGYFQRRQTQNVADAAALAAAEAIPSGTSTAAAQAYAAKNDQAGDQVSVTSNGTDSVTVTVTRNVPTYLLGILGKSSITVTSQATATVEAIGQVQGHVAPYAVTQDGYANGSGTTLFTQNNPGGYGTVDLPAVDNTTGDSGCNTTGNVNKGTQQNLTSELQGTLLSGPIRIGSCLSLKSGATQPAGQITQNMSPGDNNMGADLQTLGNGTYQVIPHTYDINGLPPRLLYVPIVDVITGGNPDVHIQGFAWFYMTGTTGSGSSLTINGRFVTIEMPPTSQTTAYVPGALGQIITAELTG